MAQVTIRVDLASTYFIRTYLDENLTIDKRIQDLEGIQSAQGELTKTSFRIPLEGDAMTAFGDLTDPTQTANIDIRKSFKGSILVDGFPEYEGRFNIIGIYTNPKEVELIFISGLTSLKAKTREIFLKDLLADETIGYNVTEISSYHDDPAAYVTTNGYHWPIIDYGQNWTADQTLTTRRQFATEDEPLTQIDFKPAISLTKIFELLNTEENIKVNFDSSIDDLAEQCIPCHNNESSVPVLDTSPLDYAGYMESTVAQTGTVASPFGGGGDATVKLAYDTKSVYNAANTGNFDLTTEEFTAPQTGAYNVSVFGKAVLDVASGTEQGTVTYYIAINGTNDQVVASNFYGVITSATQVREVNWNGTVNLVAGDTMSVNVRFRTAVVPSNPLYTLNYSLSIGQKLEVLEAPTASSASVVNIGASIDQELTVWDCIRGVVGQCNGIVVRNGEDDYDILPWVEWIELGNSLQLSNKLVNGQSVKIEPTSTTGAKKIRFEYEEDEDFYNQAYKKLQNETYGTLKIEDTGTDFATKEVKVTIPFAATPIANIDATLLRVPKFFDENFETVKTKPRLLYNDFSDPENVLDYGLVFRDVSGTGGYVYTETTAHLGHWQTYNGGFTDNDNNFGTSLTFFASSGYPSNNLYKRFWERYVVETYGINARKMTAQITLTPYEISLLQMNEKVFYNDGVYRFMQLSNISLSSLEPQTAMLAYRQPIFNVEIAPYYPYDIIDKVVQWRESSTGLTAFPTDGSGEPAGEIEESARAYGYYYDAGQNIATQSGQILIV